MKNNFLLSIFTFCLILPTFVKAQNFKVDFSTPGGIYAEAFPISMSCQKPEYQIRYTINGSTPDSTSTLYSTPIMLGNDLCSKSDIYKVLNSLESEFYLPDSILKAIVLRAAAFDESGNKVSSVTTHSYFIKSLGCNTHNLPVVSICADSLQLFSYDTGILVPGIFFNPADSELTGNYMQRGREWERYVNIEYYETGSNGFNQNAGLRTHGGTRARRAQQKGFKIYAREEYGKKNFKYKIFDEIDLAKHKRLVLRAFRSSLTPAGIQNWLANVIASNLTVDYTATRPVTLFLNGEYWGIYFLEEAPDERYVEDHHNVDHDSINIISAWGLTEHGSSDSFYELYYWLKGTDLLDSNRYEYFTQKVDIPDFIDYTLIELFIANGDWPVNNTRMWQTNDGGRWRWIFYDGDYSFDNYGFHVFENVTYTGPDTWPTAKWSTLFFRKLFENNSFNKMFINRLTFVNKTFFTYNLTKIYYNIMVNTLKNEIPQQIHRFNNPLSVFEWNLHCHRIDEFLANREQSFWLEAKNFFNIVENGITSFTCFPNPVNRNEEVNLVIYSENTCTNKICVYDINGRVLYSQTITLFPGENKMSLHMKLPAGVYIVKLGNATGKLVVI